MRHFSDPYLHKKNESSFFPCISYAPCSDRRFLLISIKYIEELCWNVSNFQTIQIKMCVHNSTFLRRSYFALQAITTDTLPPGDISTSPPSSSASGDWTVAVSIAPFFPSSSFASPALFSDNFEPLWETACCFLLDDVDVPTVTMVNCSVESQPAKLQRSNVWGSDPLFLLWKKRQRGAK